MHLYRGVSALSEFRQQKLLERLRAVSPKVTAIEAEYVHFADTESALSDTEDKHLAQLSDYGTTFTGSRRGGLYLVTPRPGTISPWSSKATDIVHNSGLNKVKRMERAIAYYIVGAPPKNRAVATILYDRMTEAVMYDLKDAGTLFIDSRPGPLNTISLKDNAEATLQTANRRLGLALSDDEIAYLADAYKNLKRDPTDVELMMFAQVNSEHCRHKIFNAEWIIDGKRQPKSLFAMIKNTYEKYSKDILSAYSDNAAVLRGPSVALFSPDAGGIYHYNKEPAHSVIKVETHNHPTAIAPFAGAATGIGGEIRDEAATGRGARTKMGLSGFSVSHLHLPSSPQPWEGNYGRPSRIASSLDIMLDAPIGGASFANEFGRPNLTGYFRTYEQADGDQVWGYHKPIMLAGGLGNIRDDHVKKQQLPPGSLIIQLGGPAMLIGLGGGAASSMQAGASDEELDFASVQRGNGEIERRAQEVIDYCTALGADNPILTIHDVGAGGLSNAAPELVHDCDRGAIIELRDIPCAEPGLSPLEIWCNEAQERYVLGISPDNLARWQAICERERCPFKVIGTVTAEKQLVLTDRLQNSRPIDLPMEVLFGKPPKLVRSFNSTSYQDSTPAKFDQITLTEAVERVLKLPAVGSKKFLITIGDRTVGGLVVRDQMVGPWQVPVSDVAVSATSFKSNHGEAMAIGERTPLAVTNAPAAARMAVAEAITNLAAADFDRLSDIKLSANWMAATGYKHEDEKLYESVKAIGETFCPELGLTIPVGKDSLSMRTTWQEKGISKSVAAPVSLIVSGFGPVADVARTLTPELIQKGKTALIFIDLSGGHQRLGGSALMQVYNQTGQATPDAATEPLKQFFRSLNTLKKEETVLAYHDRSDGGLLVTLLEMAFASRCGLDIDVSHLDGNTYEKLFNEELGAVLQVKAAGVKRALSLLGPRAFVVGHPQTGQTISITDGAVHYRQSREQLEAWWSNTSYHMQRLRDNPVAADQEFALISDGGNPGLSARITFSLGTKTYRQKPKVAILREQGVNGQREMAAAFEQAGFTCVDMPLRDLINGRQQLDNMTGLAVCGGFSYGDVLGAGEGWAKSILFHEDLRTMFSQFFARPDTFSFGVCNGCQMLAALKTLIPGADHWPSFLANASAQYEAREVLIKIINSPSIMFQGMTGSQLPVPVAHGEGRAVFASNKDLKTATENHLIVAQYVDNYGQVTEGYPANPNGSPKGITALTTVDGRATIMMPHPERAFLSRQLSWHPSEWGTDSPWTQLFLNARAWVATQSK